MSNYPASTMSTRILCKSDLEKIVVQIGPNALLREIISKLSDAFRTLDSENALIPIRSGIYYQEPDLGLLEWMPACVGEGSASLKLVGYHPTNPIKRDLPTVISTICTFDTVAGNLKALMDGTFLTAMRTGAMSAIASRILARPDSEILGIVGCGAQAVTQAHALSLLFPIRKIIAYDVDPESANSLAQRIGFLDIEVEIVERNSLGFLLENSDILCTCTSEDPGTGALFGDFENKPHLHINAVGSDFVDKIELPIELLRRSFVCPDFHEQARREGECQQLTLEEIGPDLATISRYEIDYLSRQNELTVFDSTGHAFADYVTSNLILEKANELELGTTIQVEAIPSDPKNPYSFIVEGALQQLGMLQSPSLNLG